MINNQYIIEAIDAPSVRKPTPRQKVASTFVLPKRLPPTSSGLPSSYCQHELMHENRRYIT